MELQNVFKIDIFKIISHISFSDDGEYIGTTFEPMPPKKFRHEGIFKVYTDLNHLHYRTSTEEEFTLALIDFAYGFMMVFQAGFEGLVMKKAREEMDKADEAGGMYA